MNSHGRCTRGRYPGDRGQGATAETTPLGRVQCKATTATCHGTPIRAENKRLGHRPGAEKAEQTPDASRQVGNGATGTDELGNNYTNGNGNTHSG